MTSQSNRIKPLRPEELADYGFAHARDLAFDAVRELWRRRSSAGMKQIDLAKAIGRDPAWVSRKLRGPSNWTLEALGALVQGLQGELVILAHPIEAAPSRSTNWNAYIGYGQTMPMAFDDSREQKPKNLRSDVKQEFQVIQ